MAKTEIKFKESMELEKAVEYLEKVVGELKQGKYIMEGDGESLLFEPQGTVKLEVEAKQKDGSQELEIELSWKPVAAAEGEEEEEEEQETPREEKEEAEEFGETGGTAPIVRILPLAGLAAAGGAVYVLTKRRRKSKLQKAAEKARKEGERLIDEGQRLLEQGESVLEKGTRKARKLFERQEKAKKEPMPS